MARRLPLVGAHVSVAGGLDKVVPRARRIEAEVVQIFPSNPRQWRCPEPSPEALGPFRQALRRAGLPLFVHTIYLINLASPDPALRTRSAAALGHALRFGALAGAAGVVTHIGFHRGEGFERALGRVASSVRQARQLAGPAGEELPPLLLETSAGSRGSLGGTPEELGRLVEALPGEAGVCLDTAHLFAAGLPIHTPEGIERLLAEIDACVGLDRVGLVHLNDSRSPLGSRSDRHENLWEGKIGREGLALWVRHRRLRPVPFVLETPGFGQEGPDRRNVRRAKLLRKDPGEGRAAEEGPRGGGEGGGGLPPQGDTRGGAAPTRPPGARAGGPRPR